MSENEIDAYAKSILNHPKPQIRLEAFVGKYLPLMFDEDPLKFNIAWINDVAKSPFLEVDVIGKNDTIEYTVPPLRKQTAVSLGNELSRVAQMAHLEANIHVNMAHAYLQAALPAVIRFTSGVDPEHEKRWRDILIRHGYANRLPTVSENRFSEKEDETVGGNVDLADNDDW